MAGLQHGFPTKEGGPLSCAESWNRSQRQVRKWGEAHTDPPTRATREQGSRTRAGRTLGLSSNLWWPIPKQGDPQDTNKINVQKLKGGRCSAPRKEELSSACTVQSRGKWTRGLCPMPPHPSYVHTRSTANRPPHGSRRGRGPRGCCCCCCRTLQSRAGHPEASPRDQRVCVRLAQADSAAPPLQTAK